MKTMILFILVLFPSVTLPQTKQTTTTINEDKVRILAQEEYRLMSNSMKTNLEKQIDLNLRESKAEIRRLEQELLIYRYLLVGIGIIVSGGIGGFVFGIPKYVKKQTKKKIKQAMYGVDPTHWPIKIPAAGLEKERDMLKALGFRNLKTYQGLDDRCTEGIIIFNCEKDEDVERLRSFVEEKGVKMKRAAYIIYSLNDKRYDFSVLEGTVNYVPANFMSTLGNYIYTLSRTLTD